MVKERDKTLHGQKHVLGWLNSLFRWNFFSRNIDLDFLGWFFCCRDTRESWRCKADDSSHANQNRSNEADDQASDDETQTPDHSDDEYKLFIVGFSAVVDPWRMLLWTLLAEGLLIWGQGPLEILIELVALVLSFALTRRRSKVDSPSLTPVAWFCASLALMVGVRAAIALPVCQHVDFLVKKVFVREYVISLAWTPHTYVTIVCITLMCLIINNP